MHNITKIWNHILCKMIKVSQHSTGNVLDKRKEKTDRKFHFLVVTQGSHSMFQLIHIDGFFF